ncbi:hypothetical protein Enr13x_10080 [Stieleria neptunia]|uniref:Secreted protein n=1 Tax=Stieleria neptunia TaxID=2527979 RepID=A0A518HK55_9BACT|nr:hypothetical protein [Stieleria neptunia]QDV41170.1 hypothetical protein Enr13x_10080 [Stieleria neptunia]
MKTFSRSLLILCASTAMIISVGCGEKSAPTSMTEGVELSEIEAYEQAVLDMESEDTGEMDDVTE